MVDLGAIAAYEPRWPGVKELNIADDWRARWVDEQSLPENAPVHYAYALVVMGDKGYGVRESGGNRWGMLEGATGGVASEDQLELLRSNGCDEVQGFLFSKPLTSAAAFAYLHARCAAG